MSLLETAEGLGRIAFHVFHIGASEYHWQCFVRACVLRNAPSLLALKKFFCYFRISAEEAQNCFFLSSVTRYVHIIQSSIYLDF
jgi:hypothetical protein